MFFNWREGIYRGKKQEKSGFEREDDKLPLDGGQEGA